MRHSLQLYIALILLLIITPGTQCEEHLRDENCGTHTVNTSLFQFDIINPMSTYHLLDTINIFSAISDTFHTQSAGEIIIPVSYLTAYIPTYKIIQSGTSFELSYANTELNPIVSIGTLANYGTQTNNFLYQRLEPYNNLQASFIPGNSGLYIFSVNLNNGEGVPDQYFKGNDYCTIYKAITSTPASNQNVQYWDSLGISSLRLPADEAVVINKDDKNYFFVNVVP